MNNYSKSVQRAQLDILKEVKRICDSEEINYFLVGGTLIGAIRHNGFIPWDDDIDVGMLRADYDRFIAACKTKLSSKFLIYDWYMDQNSPLPFLKVKLRGTHYQEEIAVDTNINDAIFIDIFPFDNAPDELLLRKLHEITIYNIRKIIMIRCGYAIATSNNLLKKTIYMIWRIQGRLHSLEYWKLKLEDAMKKYNATDTQNVVNLSGAYSYKKELKPRDVLQQTVSHIFEGEMMSIPQNYDSYLRDIYGDYMQLPPEEERVGRHHITYVDFGEFEEEYRRVEKI